MVGSHFLGVGAAGQELQGFTKTSRFDGGGKRDE
jgi:hypothetical protein